MNPQFENREADIFSAILSDESPDQTAPGWQTLEVSVGVTPITSWALPLA